MRLPFVFSHVTLHELAGAEGEGHRAATQRRIVEGVGEGHRAATQRRIVERHHSHTASGQHPQSGGQTSKRPTTTVKGTCGHSK